MDRLDTIQDFGTVIGDTVLLTPVPEKLSVQRAEAIMRVCRRLNIEQVIYRRGESDLSDRMAGLIQYRESFQRLSERPDCGQSAFLV